MLSTELAWLAGAFVVVASLASLAERKGRAYFARARLVDWAWWPFSALVVGGLTRVATFGLVASVLFAVAHVLPADVLPWLAARASRGLGAWPFAAQLAVALAAGDLLNYWNHRLRHTRWLWPFHAVHHSPRTLDWLSGVRIHPVDDLVDNVMVGAAVLALGVAPSVWLVTGPVLFLLDAWLHLDVDWDLGPLRYVVATPRFHRAHHAEGLPPSNFAGVLPLWDLVFGTFVLPAETPRAFGPGDMPVPERFFSQLLFPFARVLVYTKEMRSLRTLLLLLAAVSLAPSVARATTYDVHPGDDLRGRLSALVPGDEVVVHAGTYTTQSSSGSWFFQVTWAGTAAMPIVVRAADGDHPVLMGDPSQNVINLSGSYFTLRGFDVTGGSHGVRLGPTNVDHATIEDCTFHDLGDVAVSCNFDGLDCGFVTIRHNDITRTGGSGTGEGMYLGCNDALCIFHDSIVERNFIHDTGGSQGDGIEIKTGAYGNVVRDNVIVRTMYPGITMYGFLDAPGHAPNVVERNLVWHTGDNGIQTVGQIVVRNNIVLDAAAGGIASKSSQGFSPHDVTIVNNTVVGAGDCLHTNDWELGTGEAVIDNAFYCPSGNAARFATGLGTGADVRGNVGLGGSLPSGVAMGVSVAADLGDPDTAHVYPPVGSALIDAGSAAGAATDDFDATPRTDGMPDVGAYERGASGMPVWDPVEGFKGSAGVPMVDGGVPPTDGGGPGGDMGTPGGDMGGTPRDGGGTGGDAGPRADGGTGGAGGGCCSTAPGAPGGGAALLCVALGVAALAWRRRAA